MSDELDRLQSALRANVPHPPADARQRATTAAMAAFDQHRETIGDGGRKPSWAGDTFSSWLRGLATPNSTTYLAFAGAAGFALVAVFVVYLTHRTPLFSPEPAAPAATDPAALLKTAESVFKESQVQPADAQPVEMLPSVAPVPKTPIEEVVVTARSAEDRSPPGPTEANRADLEYAYEDNAYEVHMAPPRQGPGQSAYLQPRQPGAAVREKRSPSATAALEPEGTGRVKLRATTARRQVIEGTPAPGYRDQGRDRFMAFEANPVRVVTAEPVSTFSIDVDTASYSFMRASLHNGVLPQKHAVRVEELINYFPYSYSAPQDKKTPFATSVALLPAPWNPANRLLHIGIKGYPADAGAGRRANLVFLIDTSGSMNAPNKLPLLINSLKLLLGALAPEDRVAIVTYAGAAGVVLEPTPVADKARITAALERLRAGGSTAGGEGIRQAYLLAEQHFMAGGVNRVMLATDGDFNVGITDPGELTGYIERKRAGGVFLSVLGFGMGNYNDALMQRLAQNGNGNAFYIDTLSEARKALVEEATSMLFPIARDVKIQVEFNPAAISEYRLIGYETRLLEREDFRNDKVDAGEIGAGHTVTAVYEVTPVGSGAERIAPLRYQRDNATAPAGEELAFVKIRYKLPDAEASTLSTRPVTAADGFEQLADAPRDTRFVAAVAAFGQLLRGGRYTGEYGYADVVALARQAKGDDPFGYRAEFIGLVRLAESARAMEALQN